MRYFIKHGMQPSAAAKVNRTHPLAKGLVFACFPVGRSFYDAISGQVTGHPGTLKQRRTIDGNKASSVSALGVNGAGGQFAAPTGLDRISGAYSIFLEASLEVNTTTSTVVGSYESGAGNGVLVQLDDAAIRTNSILIYHNNGTYYAPSNSDALGANSEQFTHRFMVSADGTNTRYYAKRALDSTDTTSSLPTANASRRTTMCGSNNSQSQASVSLCLAYNRALSLAEYQALYDNPVQMFENHFDSVWLDAIAASVGSTAIGGWWM